MTTNPSSLGNDSFHRLQDVCSSLNEEINCMERKLELTNENETSIPSTEPIDPDNKRLRDKLAALESQQATMTERYATFHKNVVDIRTEISKLRRKIEFQNRREQSYQQAMQLIDFKKLRKDVLKVEDPERETSNLTKEDIDEILASEPFPEDASSLQLIAYLKRRLATVMIEKDNVDRKLADTTIKLSLSEEFIAKTKNIDEQVGVSGLATEVDPLAKKGYLFVKKKKSGTWSTKPTFFSLVRSEKGFYFLQKSPKERTPVPRCEIHRDEVCDGKFQFTLCPGMVKKDSKAALTLYFGALTQEERDEWVTKIQSASQLAFSEEEANRCGYKLLSDVSAY